MPQLDVLTMLVMTAAASFAIAAAMAAVRPQTRDGIGLWALALLLHGSCYTLYALRGQVPDWASIVLANACLSGSFALTLGAIEQFAGRPLPYGRMALPVLVLTLLFAIHIDDYRARMLITGTVLPLQLALALVALWCQRPGELWRGALLLSLCLIFEWLLLVGRGWRAFRGQLDAQGLLQMSPVQAAIFGLAFITIILSSLGFILLTKDRADAINRRLAASDELTGVAGRRTLLQVLARDMAQAVRAHSSYALLMLDIDHFKSVNDRYGHLVGDQVLRHVAQVLGSRLRQQDLLGRYGGEEFMVLLPGTDAAGALRVAEELRQAVQGSACAHPDGPITVTISLGLCAAQPQSTDCAQQLVAAADQALYAAKAAGRNCVRQAPAAASSHPAAVS